MQIIFHDTKRLVPEHRHSDILARFLGGELEWFSTIKAYDSHGQPIMNAELRSKDMSEIYIMISKGT